MIIELIDGPLKGTLHEVEGAFPIPDEFRFPDGDDLHWYRTLYCRTKATFVKTEHEDFQYSRPVDSIIYGPCRIFSKDQFLDLAIAALDQWAGTTAQEVEEVRTFIDRVSQSSIKSIERLARLNP